MRALQPLIKAIKGERASRFVFIERRQGGPVETNDRQPLSRCPACQSQNLVTADKKIDAHTYWRCKACGEVWNAQRLEAGNRNAYRRPVWK